MSTIAPKPKFAPPPSTRRRRVRFVRFSYPVFISTLGARRELVADTELTVDAPGGYGRGTPVPEMWYLDEDQHLLIGVQRFHAANPAIESWGTEDLPTGRPARPVPSP